MTKSFKENDEKKLLDYYKGVLSDVSRQVVGIDNNSEDEKKIVYALIKSHVEDLLRFTENTDNLEIKADIKKIISSYKSIVNRHFKNFLLKDHSTQFNANEQAKLSIYNRKKKNMVLSFNATNKEYINIFSNKELCEIYRFLSGRIFVAIKKTHPKVKMLWTVEKNHSVCEIFDASCNKKILKLLFCDFFIVYNILPLDLFFDKQTFFNRLFYKRYFEPIIKNIGHFCKDCIHKRIVFFK